MDANDDGDVLDNQTEYLFGTDPTTPDLEPLPKLTPDGEEPSLEFTALNAEGPGYEGLARRYTVEVSEDLVTWIPCPRPTISSLPTSSSPSNCPRPIAPASTGSASCSARDQVPPPGCGTLCCRLELCSMRRGALPLPHHEKIRDHGRVRSSRRARIPRVSAFAASLPGPS